MEDHPQSQDSVSAILDKAWNRFRTRFNELIPLAGLMFLVTFGEDIVLERASTAWGVVAVIVATLITLFVYVAFLFIITSDDETQDQARDIQKASNAFGPYLWIALLTFFAIVGGSLIFIIPGLIISVLLSVAPYVFVKEEKRGLDALIQSWHYIRLRWWSVFLRTLVLWVIIGVVSIGISFIYHLFTLPFIGLASFTSEAPRTLADSAIMAALSAFFTVPFSIAYLYTIYEYVRSSHVEVVDELQTAHTRRNLLIFIGIGIFAIILISLALGTFIGNYLPEIRQPGSLPAAVELFLNR